MNVQDLLVLAVESGASDLHITAGIPPTLRVNGELRTLDQFEKLMPPAIEVFVQTITTDEQRDYFLETGEIDFSYSLPGVGRFRCNLFRQRGSSAIVMRVIRGEIPTFEQLGLTPMVRDVCERQDGLVLVTGPTGSGKSTTLAAMVDWINHNRSGVIITLEDPIEFLHAHKSCIVNQREIGVDTQSYAAGLRAALREDPDVILVGEMRDVETIEIALKAAETGHLVFSTLHTRGAAATVDRIIDVFPPHQQAQIRVQLGGSLAAVISQQLVPTRDGKGRVAARELMRVTPAIRNLIREGKTHQIDGVIQTGARFGMKTMGAALDELHREGSIDRTIVELLKKT